MKIGAGDFVAPSIILTDAPSFDDFRLLFQALDAFNTPRVGPARFVPLAVLLRDVRQRTIGGLWGATMYSWLTINMLFVPETMRRLGLGSALMRTAEAEARARGCAGMLVDTFGFQARPFYESLGFTVFAEHRNCPPGTSCVYLRKELHAA